MSKRRQEIPPANKFERNIADEPGRLVEAPDIYEVRSWRPGPANSNEPCTQVHLILRATPEVSFVIRLKSARALDELVGILLDYRAQVWPESKS